jgi:hypothetical protein
MASNIQAQLTAGTKSMDNSGVVSPTFLAALEAVGTDPNEIASQSALSQRQASANIYATPDAETKRQAKQDSAEEVSAPGGIMPCLHGVCMEESAQLHDGFFVVLHQHAGFFVGITQMCAFSF